MEQTGTFTMKRSDLFRVVATANTTLADVILRLGLLERLFLNLNGINEINHMQQVLEICVV
jgi:hypothetical protein